MYKVQTADGRTVPFRIEKIADSLRRAFEEDCVEYTDSTIDYLAVMVTSDFQRRIQAGLIAAQEIERSVEAVLIRGGYPGAAKAYARLHEGCAQDPRLLACGDNTILQPHLAAYAAGSRMTSAIIDDIERFLRGEPMRLTVSREQYLHMTQE